MLQFDHLVHAVQSSPAEVINQMERLGFHTVQGGEHTNWGTYNSLCYFDLAYIEFLAIQNQEIASKSENPLIQQTVRKLQIGEGMIQIALRTEHMEELAEMLVKKGFRIKGPVEGKRMREDGTLLNWKMLFIKQEDGPSYPFFIEWSESDEKRREDLQKKRVIVPHMNNIKELKTVFYAVTNVNETSKRWEELLQVKMSAPKIDKEWNAVAQSFSLGKITIQFCEPIGNGVVQNQLQNCGEVPFAVEFQGNEERKSEHHIWHGMYIF